MLECLLGGMALFAAAVEVLECLLGGMALFAAAAKPLGAGRVPECPWGGMASIVAGTKPLGGPSRRAGVSLGRHRLLWQPLGGRKGAGVPLWEA